MDKKLLKILDNVLNSQKSTVDSDVKNVFKFGWTKEFQSIYIKFENDNFKKLKRFFLNSSTKFDFKFSKALDATLKKSIKNEKLIMLALAFEDFEVKSLSEQVMKKFRNLYNLMDEDLSAISLFGNDNYDSKQGLSDLLDNFTLKKFRNF